MYFKSILSCLISVTLLGGCVIGTRTVGLDPPVFPNEKDSEGLIYIESIEDNRRFEANPSVASIPSVDGDLSTTSKEKLSTLIGRQRGGFGNAMGDVALPEGGTVQEEVRELLTEGLESRGYIISDDKNAPIKLKVIIEKFWGWFTPGFAAVSFEANIECLLNFTGADINKEFIITGYGLNRGQIASNENWKLTFQKALSDFLVNLDKALDNRNDNSLVSQITAEEGVKSLLTTEEHQATVSVSSSSTEVDRDENFILYSNGIVLDTKTNLEWVAGPDKNTTYQDAWRRISHSLKGG